MLSTDPLFQWSCDTLIPDLQARSNKEKTAAVWNIATKVGLFAVQNGQIIFILANQVNRAVAFYFVSVFVTSIFQICLFQLIFHQPAPFWVSEQITVYVCNHSYAAPSGSPDIATSSLITMWMTLAIGSERSCDNKVPLKVITLCLCIVFIAIASYAQLLNGAASLDQVLLGVSLALWTILTVNFLFKERIFAHVKKLHSGPSNAPDLPITRNLLIVVAASLSAMFIGLIAFWITHSTV